MLNVIFTKTKCTIINRKQVEVMDCHCILYFNCTIIEKGIDFNFPGLYKNAKIDSSSHANVLASK